jgi:uncharacterized protein (UPF0264 family)
VKLQVDFSCKHVRQVFEVTLDREKALEMFDVSDDAGLEINLVGVIANEGVLGLRQLGFSVKRIQYWSPYPGGYQGPERIRP